MQESFPRYLFRNAAAGAVIGILVVTAILVLDVGSVGTLLFGGDDTFVGLLLMVWFFGLTFASVTMGSAVMALGRRPKDDRPDRGSRAPSGLTPALAAVRSRRHGA